MYHQDFDIKRLSFCQNMERYVIYTQVNMRWMEQTLISWMHGVLVDNTIDPVGKVSIAAECITNCISEGAYLYPSTLKSGCEGQWPCLSPVSTPMHITRTWMSPHKLHSKAIFVQKGLILLTLTTVPLMDTNFPVKINKLIQIELGNKHY